MPSLLFNTLALSLLSLCASQPIAQEHHVHRRENVYVTVQETHYATVVNNGAPTVTPVVDQVTVAQTEFRYVLVDGEGKPFTTSVGGAVPVVKETSAPIAAAPPAPAPEANFAAEPAPVESVAPPKPVQTYTPPKPNSEDNVHPDSQGAGDSGALGVVYSPYNGDGTCKSASQVQEDVSQLKGYNLIRIYGTDCNQVSNVYNARAPHQKLFIGIFDMNNIEGSINDANDGIKGDWDVCHTLSIGNELVNSGAANVEQVRDYVTRGRAAARGHGYKGPVVTTDTFIATIMHPELCDISDYLAVNAHAFFDPNTSAQDAGKWVIGTIQSVWSACGGKKDVLISETGWPHQGDANNLAVPSVQNQRDAIKSIKEAAGNDVILFTAFNDYWKHPGPFNAEQFWGMYGN